MSAALPATAPIAPDSLRLVLFGLPNAGKTSLLGALGQAKESQQHLLDGKLTDPSHALERQSHQLYDAEPRSTAEEIIAYPVQYSPQTGEALSAVILDCDGRAANALLSNPSALESNGQPPRLADEIARADTLILAVDASAPAAQMDANFTEFGQFLQAFQERRGQEVEVAGLPVYLVLTKCDLLAQPGDSTIDWTERIEERKSEVAARFRESLSRGIPAPVFGRLDLNLWATAVKRPALQGSPARPREPYQVAELFRQCLSKATEHRDRIEHTGRRLVWTAGGAGSLAVAILAGAVAYFATGTHEPLSPLQIDVETLMFSDQASPAERLRGSPIDLRERLDKLNTIAEEPGFDKLPAKLRDFVHNRAEELTEYLTYTEKLRQARRPADAVREETLRSIKEELTTSLALPRPDWAITEAGKVRKERLDECDALLAAIRKIRDAYLDLADQGRELWSFSRHQGTGEAPGMDWRSWLDEVETILDPNRLPAFPENDPLPGAPMLTYASAIRFDKSVEARADWEAMRQRLEKVRDVCAAVGLVTGVKGKPPVLLVPRTGFMLENARERVRELQTAYPNYRVDFVRAGLPDALLPELARTSQTSYDHVLEPARAAVLRQLKQAGAGNEETAERWTAVRKWLMEPPDLADWRVLALTLARLHDADASDPVTALSAFLQKSSFTIDLRGFTLDVPDSAKIKPLVNGSFNVFHPRTSAGKPALVFTIDGDGERLPQERVWRYKFKLQEGGPIEYLPGDALSASLPLRDDMMLSWTRGRSMMYQFERLSRPPRLQKASQTPADGVLVERIRLTPTSSSTIPAVPDLMPWIDQR